MTLTRFKENKIGTWGVLEFGDFKCYTFEPVGADEVRSGLDKRVPAGLYQMRWHDSPRFKRRLPHIFSKLVPQSRYILIHSGNLPEHTEGCILLGFNYDERGVWNSRAALDEFMARLRTAHKDDLKSVSLEIINDFK